MHDCRSQIPSVEDRFLETIAKSDSGEQGFPSIEQLLFTGSVTTPVLFWRALKCSGNTDKGMLKRNHFPCKALQLRRCIAWRDSGTWSAGALLSVNGAGDTQGSWTRLFIYSWVAVVQWCSVTEHWSQCLGSLSTLRCAWSSVAIIGLDVDAKFLCGILSVLIN